MNIIFLAAVLFLGSVIAPALHANCGPEWHFNTDGDFEGWWLTNSLDGNVTGGSLNLTITGNDPYMYSEDNLCIDGSARKYVKVE